MLERSSLKDLLSNEKLSAKDKLLICLAVDNATPKQIKEIQYLAASHGLRTAKGWNVSDYLSKAKPYAVRTSEGWELTAAGKEQVARISGPLLPSAAPLVVSALRKQLSTISEENTKQFVEEAIKCFETKLYRSAIVLSWVGAVSLLQQHVHKNCLALFNTEAQKRDSKWKTATNQDDMSRMKEHDFLQVLNAISVIGKSVKDELEGCLKLRNGCGHPNSLVIGEHKASAHIETLMQNVFSKY